MNSIDIILDKYGVEKRISPLDIDLRDIEQAIGFSLPDDYKYFLKNYDEFEQFIGPECVILWKYDELLTWNKGENSYQINDQLPNVIAIGGNGGGEFIGIEFSGSYHRVILSPFIDMDEFIHIGDSFTDFLSRLDLGKEWFE